MVQNRGLIFREYPTHGIEAGKHVKVEDQGDFDPEQAVRSQSTPITLGMY